MVTLTECSLPPCKLPSPDLFIISLPPSPPSPPLVAHFGPAYPPSPRLVGYFGPAYPQIPKASPPRQDVQQPKAGLPETTELVNAADDSFQKHVGRHTVKYLNKADDKISELGTDVSIVQSLASPLVQAVMETEPGKAVRQTISSIIDGIPALLKVLDDVAQIHPFIKIAVGAFRVAIELDLKRKDNDKKVSLMFVEMRDMMAVLVQLKDINKDKRAGEGNATISGRMQHLVDKTEQDIRKCANSCNAYAKKKLLSKVVHSSSWSDEFKGYIQGFTDRRREFELALSIYIGHAVNTANDKLVTIEEKMDRVLRYLDACMSSEERELSRIVDDRGGPQVVIRDEKLMRELFEAPVTGASISGSEEHNISHGAVDEFKELQIELQMDVQMAVRENLEQFQAKFLIQQREIEQGLRRTMHREGDRIIDAVISGPHDKILDPDIHEIWKEMRWRGSVKGRHFVHALQDYFYEKLDQLKRAKNGAMPTVHAGQLCPQDEWTLEYVNITRVQPIIEAFDDDASGFISVAEVNTFTTARPETWSLLHWLAYWAVGHQMSMSDYAKKINILLAKMFALRPLVLPANRNEMEKYLSYVWTAVAMLTSAFRRVDVDEQILHHFDDYTQAEEKRLSENLQTVKYIIDTPDTAYLICGLGRIEKQIFPLLYLLLKRDFEVMRLARTQCLHVDELYESTRAVSRVLRVVKQRHKYLADMFKQQRLDPTQQFNIVAFEMFKHLHNTNDTRQLTKVMDHDTLLKVTYVDSVEAQDVDPASILKYPLQTTDELFTTHHFAETEADMRADPLVRRILGHWSGFCAIGDVYPAQAMISLDLHVSPADPKKFHCKGIAHNGTDWNLKGEYIGSKNGDVHYTFSIVYGARFPTQFFSGILDKSRMTLSGSWCRGDWPIDLKFLFVFKRVSSEVMRFYPTPAEFAKNKRPRALWHFAISAVIHTQVRQNVGWSWLQKRWQTGQRYAELVTRQEISKLTREETIELAGCLRAMTPEEARFFFVLRDLRQRSITIHWHVSVFSVVVDAACDVCRDIIRGTRVICLSCGVKSSPVDLCDKNECLTSEVGLDIRDDLTSPHLPSHDIFKTHTAIQVCEFREVYRSAQDALKSVRQIFATMEFFNTLARDAGVDNWTCVKCVGCSQPTSLPCWCCIECEDSVFICVSCDAKHGGITVGEHKKTHALVRCQSLYTIDAESKRALQLHARINTLEGKLTSLDERLQNIEDLLRRHEKRSSRG
ncbi:hypothetical protein LXA43DRAFT_899476 [Ganoderma leucocontextum]|nr:hypothetical protein LXA43DRAFT_899476 [Ganoderma leucocontextum]